MKPIINVWRKDWFGKGLLPALLLAAILASLDGKGQWFTGWLGYSLLLTIGLLSLLGVRHLVAADPKIDKAAATAFLLRLVVGVTLMLLLPIASYQENEASQAGYMFKDAFIRDSQAWELSQSSEQLVVAFNSSYTGDQYGGMLFLSALLYRYISPQVHRPFLILILGATASAWGVYFLWKALRDWLCGQAGQTEDKKEWIALFAAWIMALYPEAVFLGSTHMREAIVIPGISAAYFFAMQMRLRNWKWAWGFFLAILLLLLIQPLVTLAALGIMVGLFILDGRGRLRWRQFALFGGVASIGIFLVLLVWSNLPSMNWNKPTEVFWQWLENNSNYQAYLSERGSGWIQALKDQLGEQWLLLIIIGYGVVQPVLPGTMIEPAPLLVQIINTLRALGWYALAPFLIYSGIAALRRGEQAHRAARLWLTATILLWVLIAAANAGGDQWDNPRYRTMLLAWEALLAAWGLWWGLARRDAWLWRWLAFEGACVLIFMEWYISRYHPGTVVNLGLWGTAALTLAAGALIFGGGLFWDWRKKRARK